jgi:tungstate transport system ATP-binding protein
VVRGGVPVLDIPTLAVEPGDVLALIGPNGSGKTTLLRTLAGLSEPTGGSLAFRGEPLDSRAGREAYRRRVTLVFQQPLLLDASVRSNIQTGLRLRGLPRPEREVRVAEVADRLGIAPLLDRSARSLSGGEAQRTSLARAFALRPEILFLDEPFTALDPPAREALLEDLQTLLRSAGTTVVFATHHPADAVRLAGTLAVLRQGRILQQGPAARVLNAPVDPFVAEFLGMTTLLEGKVLSSDQGLLRLAVGGAEILALGEATPGEVVTVGIRPEQVRLDAAPPPDPGTLNRLPCRIIRLAPRGPFLRADLACGFPLSAFVSPWSLAELALAEGGNAVASFQASSVHVLGRETRSLRPDITDTIHKH